MCECKSVCGWQRLAVYDCLRVRSEMLLGDGGRLLRADTHAREEACGVRCMLHGHIHS